MFIRTSKVLDALKYLDKEIDKLKSTVGELKHRLDIHAKCQVDMTNRILKLEGIDIEYQHGNTITVSAVTSKWGTKKDGTPRKKPGRKAARDVFNKGEKK